MVQFGYMLLTLLEAVRVNCPLLLSHRHILQFGDEVMKPDVCGSTTKFEKLQLLFSGIIKFAEEL